METVQDRQRRLSAQINGELHVKGPERNSWFGAAMSFATLQEANGLAVSQAMWQQLFAGSLEELRERTQQLKERHKQPTAKVPTVRQEPKVEKPKHHFVIGIPVRWEDLTEERAREMAGNMACIVEKDITSSRWVFTHAELSMHTSTELAEVRKVLLQGLCAKPLGGVQRGLREHGLEPMSCTLVAIPVALIIADTLVMPHMQINLGRLAMKTVTAHLQRDMDNRANGTAYTKSLVQAARTFELPALQPGEAIHIVETTPGQEHPLEVVGTENGRLTLMGEPTPALQAILLRFNHDLDAILAEDVPSTQEELEPVKKRDPDEDPDEDPEEVLSDSYRPRWAQGIER